MHCGNLQSLRSCTPMALVWTSGICKCKWAGTTILFYFCGYPLTNLRPANCLHRTAVNLVVRMAHSMEFHLAQPQHVLNNIISISGLNARERERERAVHNLCCGGGI